MNGLERPWEYLHHLSYFLPQLEQIECDEFRETLSEKVGSPVVPLGTHGIYAKGNMENLSPTIAIKISRTSGKMENFYIGVYCSPDEIKSYNVLCKEFCDVFTWSYDDIPGIDPQIV